MARQKAEESLAYLVFRLLPTWAVAAIVVTFYAALRWLLPLLMHGSVWARLSAAYAPLLTSVLAIFALYAELDKYKRRRLLGRQSSLSTLRDMTWLEFEHLVGEVYRQQGYKVEEKGGSGPDGGVDLVLRRSGETVLVQCKQWKTQQVGVKSLRELRGIVADEKATRGIFVTCGGYTQAALLESTGKSVELVDGPALLELIQRVQSKPIRSPQMPLAQTTKPSVGTVQTVSEVAEPTCQKCGSSMKRKTARQGPNAGNDFWGCSQYPHCRGTRPI